MISHGQWEIFAGIVRRRRHDVSGGIPLQRGRMSLLAPAPRADRKVEIGTRSEKSLQSDVLPLSKIERRSHLLAYDFDHPPLFWRGCRACAPTWGTCAPLCKSRRNFGAEASAVAQGNAIAQTFPDVARQRDILFLFFGVSKSGASGCERLSNRGPARTHRGSAAQP
jgi:hypothetical protein